MWCIKNHPKRNIIEKVMDFQSRGGQKLPKKKPQNATKVGSQTPKKFIVCCSVVIRVQK
jgi:hypothetical protein